MRKCITLQKQLREPANILPSRLAEMCSREVLIPRESPFHLPVRPLLCSFIPAVPTLFLPVLSSDKTRCSEGSRLDCRPRTLCPQQMLFAVSTWASRGVVKCGFKPPCHSSAGQAFHPPRRVHPAGEEKPLCRLQLWSVQSSGTTFLLCA